ncbi:MAG: toast rack family protein [Candidatus Caldatribacteriota bacterium]|nr:toast rack family protein [Candidatus Caldatribacteriota bacterium]
MKLKTKKRYILLILLFLIFFIITYESMADKENEENRVIPLGEVDSLKVSIKFGAGKLDLISGQEDVFEGSFQYDKSILKPYIRYETLGETGILTLSQSIKKDLDLPFPYKNIWNLKLPSDVPLQLYINTATYSGDIDLTNLQIENFHLNSGASQTNIIFNQPNLIDLKNINIKTGASTIKMLGLANANFNEMNFTGGAGSYIFDFSGNLTKKSKVSINAGAAKIILKIPSNMGTKIIFRNFPASKLDIKGFIKINEQTYISPEYGKSAEELDIEIKGGLLDVEVVSLTN